MKCPNCGVENPEKTWQCLCGHFFIENAAAQGDSGSQPAPRTHAESVGESFNDLSGTDSSLATESGDSTVQPEIGGATFGAFAPSPSPPPPFDGRFAFHGDGSTLFALYLAYVIFTICTLGIYFFWGKAKLRRYLYGQSSFAGDRFDYHGTGGELALGALKAALLFGGANLVAHLLQSALKGVSGIITSSLFLYAAFALIIPVAIVGTQRYRLSRTSWRAIRFSFRGRAQELLPQYLRDMVLLIFTFGLYSPFFQNRLRTFIVRHSYFGNRNFSYNGEGWDLFFRMLRLLLFIIPTLGLHWFWYTAWKHRYYWEHTSFCAVRFQSTMQGGELAKLRISNFFLVVFTLGFGYPWAVARSARFQLDCLSCHGEIDLNAVMQEALEASATGEGVVEMLDAGILDIDFGF